MEPARGAPNANRFELHERDVGFWRDVFCDRMLDADSPWSNGTRLEAVLDLTAVGDAVALDAHVRHRGLQIARTPQRIAHSARGEAIGITLIASGAAEICTGAGAYELTPGSLCFLHSGQPFTKRLSDDYSEHFLYVPLPVVEATLARPLPSQSTLIAAPEGLARLLADSLVFLARSRRELPPEQWRPLLKVVLELASSVFGGESRKEEAQPSAREAQRQRVLRHVEAHLADPGLAPRTIAAALRMSVRHLHHLFEGTGQSLGATILACRLDRCRQALEDPAVRHKSISEIAFAWGFNDAAHFSRSFRARFGVSPREARAGR
jgi:AraC-like DNA-binding protein